MTPMRKVLFVVGALGLALVLLAGASGLPRYGTYSGVYGHMLNAVTVGERNATDVVSAVNFDYRGFDTLIEEFILFTSVVGAATLLRKQKDQRQHGDLEREDASRGRDRPPTSGAVRVLGVALVLLTVVFGGYVVAHGQLTPGGGFQGGVILATAPLVVYLASEAKTFCAITPSSLVKASEAFGAAAYVLVGAIGLLAGGHFLANVLPLGKVGDVFSSGTIWVINVAVGLEVAAGFVVLLLAFVEETLQRRAGEGG